MIERDWAASAGRALAALAAAAAAAALAVPGARADGDPASDYLLLQNVYFPTRAPSSSAAAALQQAVDDVYAHGDRVKVALIDTVADLGAIPSLYGQPDSYAHFLGVELGLWYVGPLLVVMPAGFGVYDGGRSTAAAEKILRSVPLSTDGPDELTRSATAALRHLQAAAALRSADVTAPLVTAYPVQATRGKTATLRFDLFDDSGRSDAVVRVYENGARIAMQSLPMAFGIGTRSIVLRWPVPRKLASRRLRYCVVATDPAGNRSPPACALFLRVS